MRKNDVQKISRDQSMQNFVKSYQFVLNTYYFAVYAVYYKSLIRLRGRVAHFAITIMLTVGNGVKTQKMSAHNFMQSFNSRGADKKC